MSITRKTFSVTINVEGEYTENDLDPERIKISIGKCSYNAMSDGDQMQIPDFGPFLRSVVEVVEGADQTQEMEHLT